MATTDNEMIQEVRGFTGYTDNTTFSDSDIQEVLDVAKEEIRSHLNRPSFTFYQTTPESTHDADRALFWFTCIGLKSRAGEIGGVDLVISDLEQESPPENFEFWFRQFWTKIRSAARDEVKGAASTQITRGDDRTYDPSLPDLGE